MNRNLTQNCSPFQPYSLTKNKINTYSKLSSPRQSSLQADEGNPQTLTEDKKINARILFPSIRHRISDSQETIPSNPFLDQDLEQLRRTLLSQSLSDFQKQGTMEGTPSLGCVNQPVFISPPSLEELHNSFCYQNYLNSRIGGHGFPLKKVGMYTIPERQKRIKKYKAKLKKWRSSHPLSRRFDGRREVAFKKSRLNGKFAKVDQLKQTGAN